MSASTTLRFVIKIFTILIFFFFFLLFFSSRYGGQIRRTVTVDSQHQPTAYSQRYFMESSDLVLKLSALSISIRAEILMGLAVLNDSFKDGALRRRIRQFVR